MGKIIRFAFFEKFFGTINSIFEFDRKDAHHEKVELLWIANFVDPMRLKSFLMESDFKSCIFKSIKYFFISFKTSFPYN